MSPARLQEIDAERRFLMREKRRVESRLAELSEILRLWRAA